MVNELNKLDTAVITIITLTTIIIILNINGIAESTTKTIILRTESGIIKTEQHVEILNGICYQYNPEGFYKKIQRKKPYKFIKDKQIIEGKVIRIE